MPKLSKAQNLLLTIGAVLGSLCLLAAAAGILLGAKPLIFRSGSMEPAITTGSLALSLPVAAEHIQSGDVVSVKNSAGTRITHRVADTTALEGSARLTLKGDANPVPDAEPYTVTTADKVLFSVPLLGYAVSWLSSPAATFLGGLLTAYLLYIAYRHRSGHQTTTNRRAGTVPAAAPAPGRRRATRHRGRRRAQGMAAMTVLAFAGLTSGALTGAPPARAAFTNTGNTATATVTAAQLPAPTLNCAQNTVLGLPDNSTVNLTWAHNNAPTGTTGYLFTTQTGNAPESTPAELGADVTTRSITTNQITSNVQTVITFRIYSRYQSWKSPAAATTATYTPATLGGLIPANLTC